MCPFCTPISLAYIKVAGFLEIQNYARDCDSAWGEKTKRHDCGLGSLLRRRNCMGIYIERRSQGGVPQRFLHHLELCTDASQRSGVPVPESVPSELLFDSKFLRLGSNVLPQDRLPPVRLAAMAAAACESPITGFAVALKLIY
jgi:hypothetical protein